MPDLRLASALSSRARRAVAAASVVLVATGVAVAATGEGPTPTAGPTSMRPSGAGPVHPKQPRPVVRASRRSAVRRERAARPLFPLPAAPAYPHPCPPPPVPPGPPFHRPKPVVRASAVPAPVPVPRQRHVDLAPVRGKGMWITDWPTTRVHVGAVVARARAAGLHQLWVRTGGTYQGWYADRLLTRLLPAAHAAGLAVVGWDFPTLSDPVRDARRALLDLRGTWAGQHLDAFSADIETIYEGTFDTSRRVRAYLSRVRAAAGAMPVVATVLRPTPSMLSSYPYGAEAPYVDVFAPMVYWSCNEPGATALASLRPLAKLRPVHLIGQSYDMGPEGGRHGLPTAREIWRFLDVAKRAGALGASLYDYSETKVPQWRALSRYPWRRAH